MNKTIITLTIILLLTTNQIFAQTDFTVSGIVINENKEPMVGASVAIYEKQTGRITDANGYFEFNNIDNGEYHIHISYLGYTCIHHKIIRVKDKDHYQIFMMKRNEQKLNEIIVSSNNIDQRKKETVTTVEIVDNEFINKNANSSLMKSLESLPGVTSMEVGQGFSKPVIRGLSFNRVAVTENGIKQEGQQWGADHGLEIDQFGIEKIEVIKGPSSLMNGSDAIGGVVRALPHSIPRKKTSENEILFIGKSLNQLLGFSAMHKYRNKDWHYHIRYTHKKFGDYQVPADSFFYNRFRLPIENRKLKNTAGIEKNIYIATGWIKKSYNTKFTISNVYSKVGFFPGSHGIPSNETLRDDRNSRNIDLPHKKVNHFKIINNTKFVLPNGSIELDLGFQDNFRQEWSVFHSHYPTQKPPKKNPDLELEFKLHTFSGNIKYKLITQNSHFTAGLSAQYQKNKIDGYMFLLPKYTRETGGIFIFEKYNISSKLILNGGLRFDYGQTDIAPYYSIYTERYKSRDFTTRFYDFSWAVGISYLPNDKWNFKCNIGKSFRMPNASELSANGIHHGSFRYEVGDTAIISEYSYQLDAGLFYNSDRLKIELSPFVNYFPNFIFLTPTGSYLHPTGYEIKEADAGQVYQYVQSEAFRIGIDFSFRYKFSDNLSYSSSGEYVYATDLTYPIPFTPPLSIFSELEYNIPLQFSFSENISINIKHNYNAKQNRNARNESETPGYNLFDLSLSSKTKILNQNLSFTFHVQNIFNTKYFNHLSFYRLIELPEAGRSFQILIKIPINKTFEN